MGLDPIKIQRTFRLSFAFLITFLLTWYYEIPEKGWCFITLCVVLYEYTTVGGVLSKSYLRFIGTITAALYSLIVIYFFNNDAMINLIALMTGAFVYTYFFMSGSQNYIGLLGTMTLTIMLVNYNNIDATVLRPMNITIGILISLFVLLFFYPQYARKIVIDIQADFLQNLANMLEVFLNKDLVLETVKQDYLIYESAFLDNLNEYRRYIEEAQFETKKVPSFYIKSKLAVTYTKRIYHLISVFVFHLSSDELRSNPIIRENLTNILDYLHALRARLMSQGYEENQVSLLSLDTDINTTLQPKDPVVFIHLLFVELSNELSSLNQLIDEILFIRFSDYTLEKESACSLR
jgi:hypothetical protein